MDRRQLLFGGASVIGLSALAGCSSGVGEQSAQAASKKLITAADLKMEVGTPYPLVSLPGKKPMGQVYDRPPNYETPAEKLIGEKNYPYTDNDYYYVRYREADVLEVDPQDYTLKIGGDAAHNEVTFTYDELLARSSTTVGAVGMCSGQGRGLHHPMIPGMPWTKGDLSAAEWTGIPLKDLLKEVGVDDSAEFVAFRGGRLISMTKPQYWRSYILDTLPDETIVALKMNGEDIPFWNGYPVRLVVPGTYAPPWVKQLVEIQIRKTNHPMEWSGREATPNKLNLHSFVTTPTDGTTVPPRRPIEFTGVAYDKGDGIAQVDYSIDDGKSWHKAKLEKSYGKYTWRVWRANIEFDEPGEHTVMCRATSTTGEKQAIEVSEDVRETAGRKETAARLYAAHIMVEDG